MHLLANIIVFARALRASGVSVRPDGVPDGLRALETIGINSRSDVRDALRAVLLSRHEDYAVFDRLFARFWRVWPGGDQRLPRPMHVPDRARSRVRVRAPAVATSDAARAESPSTAAEDRVGVRTYSADEVWRRKDFATFTAEDFARAAAAMKRLAWTPGTRVTRRWVPGPGPDVDLRRLLRANAAHGHELLLVPHRLRATAPRPLILICDVSGSMEPYARILLLFAHAVAGGGALRRAHEAQRGIRRVEVFVFSTRLTRVTRQFATARVEVALARVRDAVGDWSGGTRIGEAIRSFNVHWARRVLRGDPVVVIVSDGWDLGEPVRLAREIARLHRSVRRLVWLNPLLGSPGYEPLARGMHAALPFVDDFLPVHNMVSLDALAARLNALSGASPPASRVGRVERAGAH